jgi:heat shock protein HtpX
MNLAYWKLRLSMLGTLAVIIGISTLFFTIILNLTGAFQGMLGFTLLIGFVVVFNLIQWLAAPYLIDAIYRVKELPRNQYSWLYRLVEEISAKARMKPPRLMLAQIPIPNAFAYGSPTAGKRVAVTTGLLSQLDRDEIEAVIGHELGHLKHRDVQLMMFASVLPAIFYYIGYTFLLSSMFGGGRDRGGSGGALLVGIGALALYWVLSLLVLGLSRLREYYADEFSATHVEGGARKLQRALAKIVKGSRLPPHRREELKSLSAFKSLFISDPERAVEDAQELAQAGIGDRDLVQDLMSRRLTLTDRLVELFSTHPNIVKRLKALEAYA